MTRNEAIAELTAHLEHWERLKEQNILPCAECENTINALDMAISALSTETDTLNATNDEEIQNCGKCADRESAKVPTDIISRAEAKQAIRDKFKDLIDRIEINDVLNNVPSVSAEPTTRERKDAKRTLLTLKHLFEDEEILKSIDVAIECVSAEPKRGEWIPLIHETDMTTNFPWERDGQWVIVTDGKSISVERFKKDAYDHFFPDGRWFEVEHTTAWMPLPQPYGAKMGVSE